ncbi:helix-turn-helix domain-containing protein [Marinobacter sp. MBR-105]|jgi:DNA-binding XRE family transcriptional regulator
MKTKQGVLSAIQKEIAALQQLAAQVEASDEPDLRPISDLQEVLTTRRESLGLSVPDISDLAGLAPNTYRGLENGTGNPTITTLTGIGKVLNFRLWIELK